MSHPNSSHDKENEYPSDNHKPVRKGFRQKALKKKMGKYDAMIDASKAHRNSPLGKLKRLLDK